MRNNAVALIAGAILACAASDATSASSPAPDNGIACEVAEAYVNEVLSRAPDPVIFSDEPFGGSGERRLPRIGWRKDRPSTALAAAYRNASDASPFAECPTLRAYVERRGAKIGSVAIDQATLVPPGAPRPSTWGVTIEVISMPIVSPSGREAVLENGFGCGPLCGGTAIVHLRKGRDGFWVVTDVAMTGIS
ncbi:MAG TPA: hypothetical protein PLO65_15325 [Caulobacter sp.]|nr:hypothetical protein [Caulobacter sp.]